MDYVFKDSYEFTTDWFSSNVVLWNAIIAKHQPRRVLEIGSFEGRSATHLVQEVRKYHNDPIELVCVDSWEGGVEHAGIDFNSVEGRFDRNMQKLVDSTFDLSIWKKKGLSHVALAELIMENAAPFDLVYIDGSHMASDVLLDATMAFKLLKVGGILIFDDYEYGTPELMDKPHEHPHIAIEAFIEVNANKLAFVQFKSKDESGNEVNLRDQTRLYQMYLEKKAD
jgi:predicted O-methyltransferase YrrM